LRIGAWCFNERFFPLWHWGRPSAGRWSRLAAQAKKGQRYAGGRTVGLGAQRGGPRGPSPTGKEKLLSRTPGNKPGLADKDGRAGPGPGGTTSGGAGPAVAIRNVFRGGLCRMTPHQKTRRLPAARPIADRFSSIVDPPWVFRRTTKGLFRPPPLAPAFGNRRCFSARADHHFEKAGSGFR